MSPWPQFKMPPLSPHSSLPQPLSSPGTLHPRFKSGPTCSRKPSLMGHPWQPSHHTAISYLICGTLLKCSLQYEEPRVCPTTTSVTGSEHAELPTTLQHEAYACTMLLALCLLLSWEKSHRSTTKNMPRPGHTDDSPTRAGEHTPRLTSLFSTPTPFFPVPESPS